MSLFSFNRHKEVPQDQQISQLALTIIIPNRYQPRHTFSAAAIDELAQTIKTQGLLQPIVVRPVSGQYELIAGERRFRAVKQLGWEKIAAIVKPFSDAQAASLAVIENLQREDLNPIDEAQAYRRLMELNELTQTALAQEIGKSQSYVANKLRLLKLDPKVQSYLASRELSARHGRALLALSPQDQLKALTEILTAKLTVQATEEMCQDLPGYFAAKTVAKKPTVETKDSQPKIRQRVPKDLKVQINTIKRAVKLARESGVKAIVHEEKKDDDYRITIELKRK
ncbi:MAG: nucleoid occlusion protein [Lactobacillus sp.]|nr:nucleoid occlusion protein [Lactobacillus sp.]MDN6042645.1 nucleoid occlusion protein [Lactobacillus sp.]MDN6053007.1 nucleoid occlusion protein [Lactobacillus sp.]